MSRRISTSFALVASIAVLVSSNVAFACPGCFSGNEANRIAYIVTFVIMTTLPLAMVGGGVYWLFGRMAAADAEADAQDLADDLAADASAGTDAV